VIDDEPEVILMLRDILARDGFEVTGVTSGGAALGTLDSGQRFDLVISDYRMADLDGRALHAALERRGGLDAPRLVFVTGDSLSPEIQDFLLATGCACLEKPFTPDAVRSLVRGHLG
jgi:CheY-like chemotaxis protein